MFISRGVYKNLTELAKENKKSLHYEEASSSTRQLVTMEEREQLIPPSSSSPTLPNKQRKWKDIPSFPKDIDDNCNNISKILLVSFDTVMVLEKTMKQLNGESCYPCFYREDRELLKWTKQAWLDHLERRSNK